MMMISAGQGKATGPGRFVLCGQGNLQEAERLQFTGTAEGAESIARRPPAVTTSASCDLA